MIGSLIERFREQIRKIKDILRGKVGARHTPVEEQPAAAEDLQNGSEAKVHPISSARPRRRRSHRSRGNRGRTAGEGLRVVSADEAAGPDSNAARVEPWILEQFQVAPVEGKTRFHDFDLPVEIMHAIADLGFEYCTPIQAALLPSTLAGKDAAGRAQTGTGKTAVFLISILTHLARNPVAGKRSACTPRALILAPTRELALQIQKEAKALARYLPSRVVAVFGGMDYVKQRKQLSEGPVDIIVATPGRLLDFKQQGDVYLSGVEVLVIDEADRMLDMGFMPEVRRIIDSTPPKAKRQTMLFSATLTPEITRASSSWTRDPAVAEIEPEQVAVDTVEQHVYITTIDEKFTLLYNMIARQNLERVIVFGNRRVETRRLMEQMRSYGISCALLSGEVTQSQRIRTLEEFRGGKVRVLVATDVAARGLHVEGVSHVVNYNLPMDPEDYVHRIGRTGRAGACGTSVSFATEDDAFQIPSIEKFLGKELQCEHPADEWLTPLPPRKAGPPPQSSRRNWAPRSRPRGWRSSKGSTAPRG